MLLRARSVSYVDVGTLFPVCSERSIFIVHSFSKEDVNFLELLGRCRSSFGHDSKQCQGVKRLAHDSV